MINFFRKTRKKMADDNRPIKYMRYAIGEILLVVIGILIALSINNWNEKRKDKLLEAKYLYEIREDIISDSIAVQSVRERIDEHVESAQGLLSYIDRGVIKDTIQLKYFIIHSGFLFFFNAKMST